MALGGMGSCPGLYDPRSIFSEEIEKKMKKNENVPVVYVSRKYIGSNDAARRARSVGGLKIKEFKV